MGDNIPDNAIQTVEWWVMRVWTVWRDNVRYVVDVHRCSPAALAAITAMTAIGKLAIVPSMDGSGGGIVCEPVECYQGIEGQLKADAKRQALALAHPHEEFRVVMNADV